MNWKILEITARPQIGALVGPNERGEEIVLLDNDINSLKELLEEHEQDCARGTKWLLMDDLIRKIPGGGKLKSYMPWSPFIKEALAQSHNSCLRDNDNPVWYVTGRTLIVGQEIVCTSVDMPSLLEKHKEDAKKGITWVIRRRNDETRICRQDGSLIDGEYYASKALAERICELHNVATTLPTPPPQPPCKKDKTERIENLLEEILKEIRKD